MAKVVYTGDRQSALSDQLSPIAIVRHFWRYRELILVCARRDRDAVHRGTFLGPLWMIASPLIMLVLFTIVFGYIFKGKFSRNPQETVAEFALALFVGLALFQCVGQTLGQTPMLLVANKAYIRAPNFPFEVLPVASVYNFLHALAISLGLCIAVFGVMNGYLHLSTLALLPIAACVALLCLGLAWFLSAASVFIRDMPAIVAPFSMILMFISAVFFPSSSVPPTLQLLFQLNPLAVLIEQGRAAFLDGQWPALWPSLYAFSFCLAVAVAGYWFFGRVKAAISDVL